MPRPFFHVSWSFANFGLMPRGISFRVLAAMKLQCSLQRVPNCLKTSGSKHFARSLSETMHLLSRHVPQAQFWFKEWPGSWRCCANSSLINSTLGKNRVQLEKFGVPLCHRRRSRITAAPASKGCSATVPSCSAEGSSKKSGGCCLLVTTNLPGTTRIGPFSERTARTAKLTPILGGGCNCRKRCGTLAGPRSLCNPWKLPVAPLTKSPPPPQYCHVLPCP